MMKHYRRYDHSRCPYVFFFEHGSFSTVPYSSFFPDCYVGWTMKTITTCFRASQSQRCDCSLHVFAIHTLEESFGELGKTTLAFTPPFPLGGGSSVLIFLEMITSLKQGGFLKLLSIWNFNMKVFVETRELSKSGFRMILRPVLWV